MLPALCSDNGQCINKLILPILPSNHPPPQSRLFLKHIPCFLSSDQCAQVTGLHYICQGADSRDLAPFRLQDFSSRTFPLMLASQNGDFLSQKILTVVPKREGGARESFWIGRRSKLSPKTWPECRYLERLDVFYF